jgi:hypothetical protein
VPHRHVAVVHGDVQPPDVLAGEEGVERARDR